MTATAGMKATAEKTTPVTPTKAGNPATAEAEMLATSCTHSKAGTEATAMTQATTSMTK